MSRHTCSSRSLGNEVQREVPEIVKIRLRNTMARMWRQDLRPFVFIEGQEFIDVAKDLLLIGATCIEIEGVLARSVSRHLEMDYEKIKKFVIERLQQGPCQVLSLLILPWYPCPPSTPGWWKYLDLWKTCKCHPHIVEDGFQSPTLDMWDNRMGDWEQNLQLGDH
nr:uncharacterized protein LOC111849613 isoform X2 [Paramormyrops kingsleyae]